MEANLGKVELFIDGEKIGELTSFEMTDEERWNLPEPVTVSGTIECDIIEFDEVFWCAYMGRMYAEYFRN